jgi:2-dehydropantoate 2-reductase
VGSLKIAIIGGGSLGLMWTARIQLAGCQPTLIVRTREQAQLIVHQGMKYTEGEVTHMLSPIVFPFGEIGELSYDVLILAVKQTQMQSIFPLLQRINTPHPFLITLQNGLGHVEHLKGAYPPNRILIGVTTEGAYRHSPNHVERTGFGTTWIGQAGLSIPTSSIQAIQEELQYKGFQVEWDGNINERLWRKCVINCVINPLTAIMNIRNGQLLASEHLRRIMKQLFNETIAVAELEGYKFDEKLWQEIESVCRSTSQNRSSMLQDLLAKQPTEIQYINGYVIRRGKQHGLPTPTHELVVELIQAKEELNKVREDHDPIPG